MAIHLQLLIAAQLPTCLETRDIWVHACQHHGVPLEVIELEDPAGQQLADELGLKSFPVLIADGKVRAVGRPKQQDATAILEQLLLTPARE